VINRQNVHDRLLFNNCLVEELVLKNLELKTPVRFLKGVGPSRAEMLKAAGIETVEELLSWMPVRYEDRAFSPSISSLREGDKVSVNGMISASGRRAVRKRGLSLFELIVSDGEGCLSVKYFNQPYLSGTLKDGCRASFYGTVSRDKYTGELAMINPETELLGSGPTGPGGSDQIVPVYSRIDKISGRLLRQIISGIFSVTLSGEDLLHQSILDKYGFPTTVEAFRLIHCPSPPPGVDRMLFLELLGKLATPAQKRMIYEEFFVFQAGMRRKRDENRRRSGTRQIKITTLLRDRIKSVLPFKPTGAQKRALREIVQDIASPYCMNRLLQGDVGSGKTIVALQAMMVVMENGCQAAFMAPTELLAEQHFKNLERLLEVTPFRTEFLSSAVKGQSRKRILRDLQNGTIQLIVGTHSLIQEGVSFQELGLAVIDEQHRFGVVQRGRFRGKGADPDVLVMTAPPIPRSMAMTVYGDLDVSIIDELPPGRKRVKTVVRQEDQRGEVYSLLDERLKSEERIIVVCPLVEESEQVDLKDATAMHQSLAALFPHCRVGLLHGRMDFEAKTRTMLEFRDGLISILVATTVVEVGIDIPDATVMLIEHAERFGLSQLHQLRGRVGRGEKPGLCILMSAGLSSESSAERLEVMCESNDGFYIAEKDLEIRGPGDYLGARQSGAADFHFGSLVKHYDLLAAARQDVSEIFRDNLLSKSGKEQLLNAFDHKWGQRAGLYSSS